MKKKSSNSTEKLDYNYQMCQDCKKSVFLKIIAYVMMMFMGQICSDNHLMNFPCWLTEHIVEKNFKLSINIFWSIVQLTTFRHFLSISTCKNVQLTTLGSSLNNCYLINGKPTMSSEHHHYLHCNTHCKDFYQYHLKKWLMTASKIKKSRKLCCIFNLERVF